MTSFVSSWCRGGAPGERAEWIRPYTEKWTVADSCTNEQLATYFLACIDNNATQPRSAFVGELFSRWYLYVSNARGRQFLRAVVEHLFQARGGLDVLVCAIQDTSHHDGDDDDDDDGGSSATTTMSSRSSSSSHRNRISREKMMRRTAPDLYHEVFCQTFGSVDLDLLVEIELQNQRQVCRKTPSPETLMVKAVRAALEIPFFDRCFAIHMKWSSIFLERMCHDEWAIPPQQSSSRGGMWYVSRAVFEQRMQWFCPFILDFIRDTRIRRMGAVLSGSLLPLCALRHEVYTATKQEFLAHANEVYAKCTVDCFISVPPGLVVDFSTCVLEEVLREVSGGGEEALASSWVRVRSQEWHEDETWAQRNRSGVTLYYSSPAFSFDVQFIFVAEPLAQVVAHHHLPCVRAMYDGSTLSTTASCFVAWMTRFVNAPPLFGSRIDQQRQSKTVFKYAMRGWGFSRSAVVELQLPVTLLEWLREWHTPSDSPQRPLPWYHPLYHPSLWHKAMTAARVQNLIECAEI